jgi:hypothetical protein
MNRRHFAKRLLPLAPLLGATLLSSNSARAELQPRVASPAKLTLLHVRAADVALALGGSVIDDVRTSPEQVSAKLPAWGRQNATQLLPEGITSILGYNRDNSLLVQFDDPAALAAFRNLIRLLDVAPRRVEVNVLVEAVVRDGGRAGKATRVELRTITLAGQGARASSTQSEGRKAASNPVNSGAPRITAFEWYVEPTTMGENASLLRVTTTGSVTVAWQKPGTRAGTEPVRVQHFFDGTTQTRSGSATVVSRATLPLDDTGATAEITLTLTPRPLPGGATPPPAASSPKGAQIEAR